MDFQPIGSAPNADAARQGALSSFFFTAANLLAGIDSSPRVVSGPGNGTDQLGFGTTLGVDVGVGNNGEVFVRGRTGQVGTDDTSISGTPSGSSAMKLTPLMLIGIAAAAFFLLK